MSKAMAVRPGPRGLVLPYQERTLSLKSPQKLLKTPKIRRRRIGLVKELGYCNEQVAQ